MPSPAIPSRVLRLYAVSLRLLPASFRSRYAGPMLQAVRDALAEDPAPLRLFVISLLVDVVRTAVRERISALPRYIMKRPIAVYTAALIVLLCAFSLISALVSQQLLRRGANQPQQQMAERYAAELAGGADPADVLPTGRIDPSRDLDPFVIFYGPDFAPVHANATLGGLIPAPPPGVFEHAARQGGDVLTWMPRRDARVAMVMLGVNGPHPGYLLVGRSLSVTELYEGMLYHGAVLSMAIIVLLILAAGVLLARAFRRVQPPAPAPAQ